MDGAGVIGSLLGSVASMVLALGLMLGGPVLYLVLQVRALWRWDRAPRFAYAKRWAKSLIHRRRHWNCSEHRYSVPGDPLRAEVCHVERTETSLCFA